ncbi:MAG: hypothetical protein DRP01_04855 [Archaeoglobales archaeon]|nr:MAG: hypothetical protein DRP01_04855 [Archaeoglobales archaeon]
MTKPLPNIYTPTGVGIYLRSISQKRHGTPEEAAKRAKDHGISFVAIMACWQDIQEGKFRQINANKKHDTLQRYSEAFLKEGIEPWVWGYPWAGHEEAYLDAMFDAWVPDVTVGTINDPELGSKWTSRVRNSRRNTMRGQPEAIVGVSASGNQKLRRRQADDIMTGILQRSPNKERIGYMTTSYGVARYHKNFPWKEYLQFGAFSPQLYDEELQEIDRALDEWLAHWRKATGMSDEDACIVPSVAAYGEKAQLQMRKYLSSFLLSKHPIQGVIVWSWRQLDAREWNELARFAGDIEEGATRL